MNRRRLCLVFGWPTVITAYSLLMTLTTAMLRETSDSLQETARLILNAMKRKDFEVDYVKLLGSLLPLPADYQHLLEAVTSNDSISLRSVVLLSEISENTMNAQKRKNFCQYHKLDQEDTFIDLSCRMSNVAMRCNANDKEFLSIRNSQFSVDMSQVYNPYGNMKDVDVLVSNRGFNGMSED